MFADAVTRLALVPRFKHPLVDQTNQRPVVGAGALPARLAQIAMMTAFRDPPEDLLESVTRMMGELYRDAGFEEVASTWSTGGPPSRTSTARRIERGRREGLQEGELKRHREGLYEGEMKRRTRTIEGLLGRALPWSTIEAATGIDEAAFRKFKRHATDDGAN